MKNLFLLPTEKPTWLHKSILTDVLRKSSSCINDMKQAQGMNIYITNSEEIKEGDWFLQTTYEGIFKCSDAKIEYIYFNVDNYEPIAYCKKIILTTDPSLAPDVQKIDDTFLEWFVNNPSCEEIKVNKLCYGALSGFADAGYKIIIPKEEPKQERMYSEEIIDILDNVRYWETCPNKYKVIIEEWFEQFKKKA